MAKKARRKRCDDCDEVKDDVETVIDPYIQEIHNEEIERQLCTDCYNESVQDI